MDLCLFFLGIGSHLVNGSESAVAEDPATPQLGFLDDPQLGQVGFDVAGPQRLAVLVSAHNHRHLGRVLLGFGPLVPVVTEAGQEDAQERDASDDSAHDGGDVLVVAVVQRVGHGLLGAVRIATVAREDLVRCFRRTVGRAVELRRVIRRISAGSLQHPSQTALIHFQPLRPLRPLRQARSIRPLPPSQIQNADVTR